MTALRRWADVAVTTAAAYIMEIALAVDEALTGRGER